MLTLWKPSALNAFGSTFDDFFASDSDKRLAMAVDVSETDNAVTLTADLPGVDEKQIAITVEDGVLALSAEREESSENANATRVLRERHYGRVERRFRLSNQIDASKIEASYKQGVLTIVLPKREEAKPRQISVKAGN
jgi:HSP20 family protein